MVDAHPLALTALPPQPFVLLIFLAVFFADEYREAHPEHAEFIDAIDDEIREQGLILKVRAAL